MTLSPGQQQKNAILQDLQTLVNSGVLNSAFADDMSKVSPLDRVWSGFPSAVVLPPVVTAMDFEDTATNNREYTWYINVVTTPDNMPANDPLYLEGLVDSIVALFDMDATLQGTADAGLYPCILESPGVISSNSVTYVVFTVQLKTKCLVPSGVQ